MRGSLGSRDSGSPVICSDGLSEVDTITSSGKQKIAATATSSKCTKECFLFRVTPALAQSIFDALLRRMQRVARSRASVDRVLGRGVSLHPAYKRRRNLGSRNLIGAASQLDKQSEVGIAL